MLMIIMMMMMMSMMMSHLAPLYSGHCCLWSASVQCQLTLSLSSHSQQVCSNITTLISHATLILYKYIRILQSIIINLWQWLLKLYNNSVFSLSVIFTCVTMPRKYRWHDVVVGWGFVSSWPQCWPSDLRLRHNCLTPEPAETSNQWSLPIVNHNILVLANTTFTLLHLTYYRV